LIGCEGAVLAAGCGLRFWAGLTIEVISKVNSAMCRKNFGMALSSSPCGAKQD